MVEHGSGEAVNEAVKSLHDDGAFHGGAFPCPKCGSRTGIVDSRPVRFRQSPSVRRRRACQNVACKNRLTTYEIIDDDRAIVKLHQVIASARVASNALLDLISRYDRPVINSSED